MNGQILNFNGKNMASNLISRSKSVTYVVESITIYGN